MSIIIRKSRHTMLQPLTAGLTRQMSTLFEKPEKRNEGFST
jgi:hypothetical protein